MDKYDIPVIIIICLGFSVLLWQAFSKHPFKFFPFTEVNRYHPYYKPHENDNNPLPTKEEIKKRDREDMKYHLLYFYLPWLVVIAIVNFVFFR